MRLLSLFLLPVLLFVDFSCLFGAERPVAPAFPVVFPLNTPVAVSTPPFPLTREAEELRRLREEHAALIASIPPTPEPAPTLTVAEVSSLVSARVRAHPEGVPFSPRVEEGWFDPERGLEFHRDEGGDWTPRNVRESHSHRDLFYYGEYPDSIPNFSDGSIHPLLSRELAFEASAVLPFLGDPTPAMINAFSRDLGWELRDSPGPVVNLWTTFVVRREGLFYSYAVGGVMLLGVSSVGEGEELVEFVGPGRWIGPVVVERLR